MGLMQVMPSTAKFISTNKEVKRNNSNILKKPELNLRCWARVYRIIC